MKKYFSQGVNRYFIAIVPPSPVFEEVLALKNYFKEKYESKAALNSPPHITLHMPFLWKEKKEDLLISSLQDFAADQKPATIKLSNFSPFPPRVIFINVSANEELNKLQLNLHRFCKAKLNLFNAEYKDIPFHPHLTLAFRDLKKPMFAEAWSEFKDKTFSASFHLDKITLLKHDGKIWQQFSHFHF